MKTSYSFLLLMLSFFVLVSCDDDDVAITQLEGVWVEQDDKMDTISF